MTIPLSIPGLDSYFEDASVGIVLARCLIIAFVILALGIGFYQFRCMRRRLNLLDEETLARRAQDRDLDEELCGVGSSQALGRPGSKPKRDPWES